MTTPPADSPRPLWKSWWGIGYLALVGLVAVATIIRAVIPAQTEPERFAKGIFLQMGGIWLAILLGILIIRAAYRRRFWRLPTVPTADRVVSLILSILAIYGLMILLSLTCKATQRN